MGVIKRMVIPSAVAAVTGYIVYSRVLKEEDRERIEDLLQTAEGIGKAAIDMAKPVVEQLVSKQPQTHTNQAQTRAEWAVLGL